MKDEIKIKELVHIRCLLEGIWLDSNEAKDGCTLENVEERAKDEFNEIMGKIHKKGIPIPIRKTTI